MIEGTEYEKILNMTDEQAADILEKTIIYLCGGRMNGKTILSLSYRVAILKAINKLRGN